MSAAPSLDLDATHSDIRAVTEDALPRRVWQKRYATRLLATDFVILALVISSVQFFWLGFDDTARFAFPTSSGGQFSGEVSYGVVSGVILILWMTVLIAGGSVDSRVMGVGQTEYRKVTDGGIGLFAAVASVIFVMKLDVARGYLLVTFAIGIGALVISRWLWRKWLKSHRMRGDYSNKVVLVGSRSSIRHISTELAKQPWAGYHVVGAALAQDPRDSGVLAIGKVPVISDFDGVRDAMDIIGADTVIITGADDLDAQRVRELGWELEDGEYSLVMAPSLTDVSGPRIHSRPVAGLPLMHVETPKYTGLRVVMKRSFDLAATLAIAVLLAPVVIVLALLIKLTSPGPLLYRSERIGQGGEPFQMLKFRSMRAGADKELQVLLQAQGTSESPLFKVHNDPRITPIGRVLRKYSLDELPQLFNVLGGSMSLIGPRPQIAAEVALYSDAHRRRLIMRPGVTGLWQVSGRSELDWEQAVRLDLYYIENWSLTGDIVILFRTVKAVVIPGGTAH